MKIDPALRILLVDDMPTVRAILRGMLQELGYGHIEETEDAEVAWNLIRQATIHEEPYDLIISDWMLQGMSGMDLLRGVRGFPATRTVPFLIVSSQGGPSELREAASAGVSGYLVKPFTVEQLGEKMREALSRS